jgi:hypothetical protein
MVLFFDSYGTPELSAMYILGLTLWMVTISLFQLIRIAFDSQVINISEYSMATFILLGFITLIIYGAYVRKGKFKKIDDYFVNKDRFRNSRGNIVTTLYLLLSIFLFFGIVLLKK